MKALLQRPHCALVAEGARSVVVLTLLLLLAGVWLTHQSSLLNTTTVAHTLYKVEAKVPEVTTCPSHLPSGLLASFPGPSCSHSQPRPLGSWLGSLWPRAFALDTAFA